MLSKPKLDLSYQKFVLSLICQLPDENTIIWLDVNEMRDRLICGGVDRAIDGTVGDIIDKSKPGRMFTVEKCISRDCLLPP